MADDAVVPQDGAWTGTEIDFEVAAGQISAFKLNGLSCDGESCAATFEGDFAGAAAAGASFRLTTGADTIEGSFSTPSRASGTFDLVATDGCCRAVGVWTATWVPGSAPGQDADAGGGADGGGATGSLDWSGASTGTIHPGPSRTFEEPKQPEGLSAGQLQGLVSLNSIRAAVGVPPATQLASIAQAAQAHADFYVAHATQYSAAGLSPHAEDASFGDGFTGANFGQRMAAAGFGGAPGAEVMAFTGSAQGAMQGWLETVYHRLPLVDPRTEFVGVGLAKAGGTSAEVMNTSAGGEDGTAIVVYPVPGQEGVARRWLGNEGPQPPAPPAGYPSGPVISARMPGAFEVLAHRLIDEDTGTDVAHVWLDKANDPTLAAFDTRTVVLYANSPLAAARTYRVRLELKLPGAQEVLQWRFTTAAQ